MQELPSGWIAGKTLTPWKLDLLCSMLKFSILFFFLLVPCFCFSVFSVGTLFACFYVWFQHPNYLVIDWQTTQTRKHDDSRTLRWGSAASKSYLCWCAKSRIPGFLDRMYIFIQIWSNVGKNSRVKIRDLSRKKWQMSKIRDFFSKIFIIFQQHHQPSTVHMFRLSKGLEIFTLFASLFGFGRNGFVKPSGWTWA